MARGSQDEDLPSSNDEADSGSDFWVGDHPFKSFSETSGGRSSESPGEKMPDVIGGVSVDSLPSHTKLPCNQCLFYASSTGCMKGTRCAFCHHTCVSKGSNTARPRRTKREQYKVRVQQLLQMLSADQGPPKVVDALQKEAQRNRYARTLCQGLLGDWLEHHENQRRSAVAARPAEAREDFCRAWLIFSL